MKKNIDIKKVIEHINNKFDSFPLWKKSIVLLCLLFIFISLFYIATIDKITIVEYKQYDIVVCTEQYINGKLNGSSCEEYYIEEKWQAAGQSIISKNLKLMSNQS